MKNIQKSSIAQEQCFCSARYLVYFIDDLRKLYCLFNIDNESAKVLAMIKGINLLRNAALQKFMAICFHLKLTSGK